MWCGFLSHLNPITTDRLFFSVLFVGESLKREVKSRKKRQERIMKILFLSLSYTLMKESSQNSLHSNYSTFVMNIAMKIPNENKKRKREAEIQSKTSVQIGKERGIKRINIC